MIKKKQRKKEKLKYCLNFQVYIHMNKDSQTAKPKKIFVLSYIKKSICREEINYVDRRFIYC